MSEHLRSILCAVKNIVILLLGLDLDRDSLGKRRQYTVERRETNTKVIILTDHSRLGSNSAMNQSKFIAILCNLLKAREKSRVQVAIGFGFPSHWLIN